MSIYGVKFRALGQTSYYSAPEDCTRGDQVVAEADQGLALGTIESGPMTALPGASEADLPSILRLADAEDREIGRKNEACAREAMRFCRECIRERRLDMKLVDVEVFFDRSKFIFYFTAPSRIDFRELVKDLVREYRARIELRQIGVRHETQMIGAVGNCGMVCCCRRYLRKFAPVTIRMAKEQNLFLNPAKISGICGRLLCCLSYEQENYEHFHKNSPRPGKKYQTAKGIIKVVRANMFRNSLSVLTEANEEQELSLEDWQALEPRRLDAQHTQQARETASAAQPEAGVAQGAKNRNSSRATPDDAAPGASARRMPPAAMSPRGMSSGGIPSGAGALVAEGDDDLLPDEDGGFAPQAAAAGNDTCHGPGNRADGMDAGAAGMNAADERPDHRKPRRRPARPAPEQGKTSTRMPAGHPSRQPGHRAGHNKSRGRESES